MLVRVLAMALCLSVCVCHKSVFYQNGCMNRAGFWYGRFLLPILYCVRPKKEIWVSSKIWVPLEIYPKLRTLKILLWHIDRRNVLPTSLNEGGRSERDKLDRRRSTKLTIPPSFDARLL